MPIMARTSGGIYKAVSDIYDTQGNAISKVYDNAGNTVFKKDNVIHLSFPNSAMSYEKRIMIGTNVDWDKYYYVPLIDKSTNSPIKYKDVVGRRIIITGKVIKSKTESSGAQYSDTHYVYNQLVTMNSAVETTDTQSVYIASFYESKTTYDNIIAISSPDDYYLGILIRNRLKVNRKVGTITYTWGCQLYDDPQII